MYPRGPARDLGVWGWKCSLWGIFLRNPSPYLCEFWKKPWKILNHQVNKWDRELNPATPVNQFWGQNWSATYRAFCTRKQKGLNIEKIFKTSYIGKSSKSELSGSLFRLHFRLCSNSLAKTFVLWLSKGDGAEEGSTSSISISSSEQL